MGASDYASGFQVGNGAGDFDGAHIGAGGDIQADDGGVEELSGFGVQLGMFLDIGVGHIGIQFAAEAITFNLDSPGLDDALSYLIVTFGVHALAKQFVVFNLVDIAVEVNPVEDGAGKLLAVANNLVGQATAGPGSAVIAAGTGVGGGHQD